MFWYAPLKELKNEEGKKVQQMGLKAERGKETLRKPLPTREVQKGKNREMREKNANAKKINRPRQLYPYKS